MAYYDKRSWGPTRSGGGREEPSLKPARIDPNILEQGITSAAQIENLKEWGKYFAIGSDNEKVSTSQLRKFFGEIKRIQADFDNCKADLILLDPKIAYAVGKAKKDSRNKPVKIEDFYFQLSPLIKSIAAEKKKFRHFVQICEAIVAYHKQFGGI